MVVVWAVEPEPFLPEDAAFVRCLRVFGDITAMADVWTVFCV
jgi:hypothetical protein